MTILQDVLKNKDVIVKIAAADGHKGLNAFAKRVGYDNASAFGRFKKALKEIGVCYDTLRFATIAGASAKKAESVTHEVVMFSDAKAKNDRFGITDSDGEALWHGRFFDNDYDYNGEQSTGEMSAAKKAVWLASQVAKKVGGVVKLKLFVDAEWLTWANENNPKVGGKARALRAAAEKLGVVLRVEHVAGSENPADEFTVCRGFKKWQDNDLSALAVAI